MLSPRYQTSRPEGHDAETHSPAQVRVLTDRYSPQDGTRPLTPAVSARSGSDSCIMSRTSEATADFDYIISLVYERSRICLNAGKHSLIHARLGKRMRTLGVPSLAEYCDLLRGPDGEEEITNAIDALTTNFTRFLREEKHFQFLVREAIPAVLRLRKQCRVWSAACATGEEPYSLAVYLMEHFPPAAGPDWNVLATDISTRALARARDAIYTHDQLRDMPPEWLRRHFQRGHGDWQGHYRVKPALAARVRFLHLNLLGPYPFNDVFDVIFCRNVMIYFDRPTQEQLIARLHRHLAPGGYLVVGHSESLAGLSVPVHCLKPSIYQRV